MKVTFHKYEGTGNDFIMIDDRLQNFPFSDQDLIQRMCDRHFGIGADGLILLQNHDQLDFRMVYFNADGKESSMCGNGGRCITAYAKHLGLITNQAEFEAMDGVHKAIIDTDNSIRLKMSDIKTIEISANSWIMDTGSPHFTKIVTNLSELDIINEARKIRYHERFVEHGINVNYLEMNNGQVSMRTYERGVEDETLSCGTGTVAVAVVIALQHANWKPNEWISIGTPGGELDVRFAELSENFVKDIWLKGPAKFVFAGSYMV